MNRNEGLLLRIRDQKTISISRDLQLGGAYPSNLILKRTKNTNNLYAHFLPEEKLDVRPFAGRSSSGTGKRITISKSMRTDDPMEAANKAIKWAAEKIDEMRILQIKPDHTLRYYWNNWFATQCQERESKRNFDRWKRDTRAKWEGEGYGIKHQDWAQKDIGNITSKDFKNYFALLTKRGKTKNASGIKEQQKTLINHLFNEARDTNNEKLVTPKFPTIGRQVKQVNHFTHEQWQLILKAVIDKSGGIAQELLSKEEYTNLDYSRYKDEIQRNWVDLYDALCVEWFFYLRAEDMVRIKTDWFTNIDDNYVCLLETTKKDRPIHRTHSFRDGANDCCKRILSRKPSGYLVFPDKIRPANSEASSNVLRKLNKLLKIIISETIPDFPMEDRRFTTIRHTAFRLTLEDDPSLGGAGKINSFAYNGHTSVKQLHDTYLRHIDPQKHAEESRKVISKGRYDLVKRLMVA